MLKKFQNYYEQFIESERDNLPLFIPVFFALGIGIYFYLDAEPNYIVNCIQTLVISSMFLGLNLYSKFKSLHEVSILTNYKIIEFLTSVIFISFLISSGYFIAQTRAILVESPKIESDLGVIWLRGTLKELTPNNGFKRIITTNNDLWQPETGKFEASKIPHSIRLNVRTKIAENVSEGDVIAARIILSPPPLLPAVPGGYDFAKKAYFQKLGAVGFTISEVKLYKKQALGITEFINNLRRKISENITKNLKNSDSGAIISKILVNISGNLDKQTEKNIRETGLGHLLAISGLHMTIVMLWSFTIVRFLAGFTPIISLNYNIKSIAAISSITIGFIYLLLCNFPISAIRSYTMVSAFLLAILISRDTTLKRPIAFAAMFILILMPESLTMPGFQMSFAAVIALTSLYRLTYLIIPAETRKNKGFSVRVIIFLSELCVSTFVAGLITAPYAIYHFGTYAKYSIFANMIAIPAISMLTMPFAFLSLIFTPLGIEILPLKIASFGADLMVFTANYLHNFSSEPTILFPALPKWLLFALSLPLVSLFILRNRFKYLLLTFVLYAFYLTTNYPSPDILIPENAKTIIYKNGNNYYYSGKTRRGFAYNQWLSALAIKSTLKDKECALSNCNTSHFTITDNHEELSCNKPLIINLSEKDFACKNARVVNYHNFKNQGTLLYYRKNQRIISSQSHSGKRIWNTNYE